MVRPGMNDGRIFTNYDSNCKMNEELKVKLDAKNSNDYRMKLQQMKSLEQLKDK
jgi:hypothetical protein